MKALFPLLLIVGVLLALAVGIQQGNEVHNVPPITGAFGFTLGQELEGGHTNEDGGFDLFLETTNFPPFKDVFVNADAARTIYRIMGSLPADTDPRNEVRQAIWKKYGNRHAAPYAGHKTSDQFQSGNRMVEWLALGSSIHVIYSDDVLASKHRSDIERRSQKVVNALTNKL